MSTFIHILVGLFAVGLVAGLAFLVYLAGPIRGRK